MQQCMNSNRIPSKTREKKKKKMKENATSANADANSAIQTSTKMRRNSKVRTVKIEELETRSCVNEKIQNKRGMRWW